MSNTNTFEIKCKKCGSTDIEISKDTDYDCMDRLYDTGNLCCVCQKCGNYQIVDFVNKHYSAW